MVKLPILFLMVIIIKVRIFLEKLDIRVLKLTNLLINVKLFKEQLQKLLESFQSNQNMKW